MIQPKEKIISLPKEVSNLVDLFGINDCYLNLIKEKIDINIIFRNGDIKVRGNDEDIIKATKVLRLMIEDVLSKNTLSIQSVTYFLDNLEDEEKINKGHTIIYNYKGVPIKTKTTGQTEYINKIKENDIVFGIGPAGTGKTFLCVAMAVKEFKNNNVDKIILTRPAVEAGESLGFLPGDLREKIDPYLKPLYDSLIEIMGRESFEKNLEKGSIEIAPLAYMRGRTLSKAFIILDEAQNTTKEQMKMFLTRLGFNSKIVVTGDVTQIDLPKGQKSGLLEVKKILNNIKGVSFINLTYKDVVRNPLVQKIINAYENYEK